MINKASAAGGGTGCKFDRPAVNIFPQANGRQRRPTNRFLWASSMSYSPRPTNRCASVSAEESISTLQITNRFSSFCHTLIFLTDRQAMAVFILCTHSWWYSWFSSSLWLCQSNTLVRQRPLWLCPVNSWQAQIWGHQHMQTNASC